MLVAGSTHDGEEQIILDVYKRLLKIHPISNHLGPTAPERAQAVAAMARNEGLEDIILMSEISGGKKTHP